MLAIVMLMAAAVLWPHLTQENILPVRAPSLEHTFGFHGEYVARAYVLTQVANGGRWHQAGFRSGDRPSVGICRFNGDYVSAEAFFDDLDHVLVGHAVEFTVGRGEGDDREFVRLTLPARAAKGRR